MNKICDRCDAKNDIYATVCQNCGYKFYDKEIIIKKSKKRFFCFLIFGFIIPLLLVSAYFVGLYGYLYGVENYNSEVYLRSYLSLIENKKYDEIMTLIDFKEDKFNSREEFISYLNKEYLEDINKVTVIRDSVASTEEYDIFRVQFNDSKIKEFKVKKTDEKKLKFFNTWVVAEPEKDMYKESVKIYAPIGVDVYVNGEILTDEYITSDVIEYNYYDSIKSEDYQKVKNICYNVDKLLAVSSVEVKHKNGEICQVEQVNDEYIATCNIPADLYATIQPLAEATAKKYAEYIAEDCKFSELSGYIYKDSEFYYTLREFYNGWFPLHDTFNYENIQFEKNVWYDATHCSIQVKFIFYITYKNGKRRDYDVAYDLYFINDNGEWKVADIINY